MASSYYFFVLKFASDAYLLCVQTLIIIHVSLCLVTLQYIQLFYLRRLSTLSCASTLLQSSSTFHSIDLARGRYLIYIAWSPWLFYLLKSWAPVFTSPFLDVLFDYFIRRQALSHQCLFSNFNSLQTTVNSTSLLYFVTRLHRHLLPCGIIFFSLTPLIVLYLFQVISIITYFASVGMILSFRIYNTF